ncbi:glycine cleavage system transcriptional repressor [Proteus mirabilis]|nr:glycine cleavage system transcriptional repressor [Proteus mirabilis]WFC27084.1 glycine cleavage system transcriptional repressor [Proteus mirabilis]
MPIPDKHFLVLTALGTDRPGIVDTITQLVSQCGCNIEDSRLAMFGQEFTFIMLLSGGWNAIAQLEALLPIKSAELDLLTVMKRTKMGEPVSYPSTITAKVDIEDAPGIVERFTNLFSQHHFNLAELVSKTHPSEDGTPARLEIQITAHNPLDDHGLVIHEKFNQLCTELNAQGTISIVNSLMMKQ